MNNRKSINRIVNIISLVMLALVLISYSELPDMIPVHWGMEGTVDRWGSKELIFYMWAIIPGIDLLMRFAEKIDPKGENYKRFDKVFGIFRVGMALFMSVLVVVTIVASFDPTALDMNKMMFPLVGLMLAGIGNYMPKVKYNYTFGIKTPHTLASENVWNKTHRISGPLWMICGVIIVICAFLKGDTAIWTMIAVTAVMVVFPMVYAYLEYKKEFPEKK